MLLGRSPTLLPLLLLAACSTTTPAPPDGGDGTCTPGGSSNLPGVRIEFCAPSTTFRLAEAASGITIAYRLIVAEDIQGVHPRAQDAGRCDRPQASGLILFASLAGAEERYCLCDVGHCPPPSDQAVTVRRGVYPASFSWDGRNWTGPSDFNQPKGPPFPAGEYQLTVSAVGQVEEGSARRDFTVSTTLPLRLVD